MFPCNKYSRDNRGVVGRYTLPLAGSDYGMASNGWCKLKPRIDKWSCALTHMYFTMIVKYMLTTRQKETKIVKYYYD